MIAVARSRALPWWIGLRIAAVFMLITTRLPAQSTARVGSIEPQRRFELSAGMSSRTVGGKRVALAALAAARWRGDGAVAYRLWALWSRLDRGQAWNCYQYPCPSAIDFFGAGASGELSASLGRYTSLAASAGAGYAIPRQTATTPYAQQEERVLIQAGLAVRRKHFVVETHFLLIGGDAFFPITMGLRF